MIDMVNNYREQGAEKRPVPLVLLDLHPEL